MYQDLLHLSFFIFIVHVCLKINFADFISARTLMWTTCCALFLRNIENTFDSVYIYIKEFQKNRSWLNLVYPRKMKALYFVCFLALLVVSLNSCNSIIFDLQMQQCIEELYLFIYLSFQLFIFSSPPLVFYPLIARVAQLRLTGHNRSTSKINKAYYDTKLGKTCLQGMWYKDCNIGIKDNYQISSIDKNQACKFRKDISIVIILD